MPDANDPTPHAVHSSPTSGRPRSPALHVDLRDGTQDVLDRVYGHLSQAADWAQQAGTEQEYTLRHQAIDRMERSFWQSWTTLFMQRRSPDDALHITPDPFGPDTLSLEWHYDSGYHGGLLYHPTHRDGQPQPYGIWSIHT
jgi:hypothetical protein